MPALVGQGEDVAKDLLLVVHEDIGFAREGTGGEGPGTLALVLVAVHPARLEALPEGRDIFLPEGGEGLGDEGDGLLVGVPCLGLGEDRHVDVIVPELVDLQCGPAQLVVLVEGA
jgi:hypothetical protein